MNNLLFNADYIMAKVSRKKVYVPLMPTALIN